MSSKDGRGAQALVEIGDKPIVEALTSHPDILRHGWPKRVLTALAEVAYRSVYHYASRRSTVGAEVPALEAVLAQADYA